jgi:metal-responsive CopG/Arc/MetJ family transcriptional regulator
MNYKKAMFSLPEALLEQLPTFAKMVNEGNKSSFVADAIKEKIERVRKLIHTQRLRESYRQAAQENLKIIEEWKHVDAETRRLLDDQEKI